MPLRLRKLVGMLLLVTLVLTYAIAAILIATATLADSSAWTRFTYFSLSGLVWVLPAMAIIKWMEKPVKK